MSTVHAPLLDNTQDGSCDGQKQNKIPWPRVEYISPSAFCDSISLIKSDFN